MVRVNYSSGKGIATGGNRTNSDIYPIVSPLINTRETFNITRSCDYLSADGYGFDLSGTKKFFVNSGSAIIDGDYSGIISGISGSSSPYSVAMTVNYNGAFADIDTTGLWFEFYKNPVSKFKVVMSYNDNGTTGTITRTISSAINSKKLTFNLKPSNIPSHTYTGFTIQEIEMVNAGARAVLITAAKGNSVSKGQFDKLKSHNLIEEINVLSTDLPINQFEFVTATNEPPSIDSRISVYSNDKYYGEFWIKESEQVGQKLEYEINHGEWIETVTVGEDLYSITAVNAVDFLDRSRFLEWRSDVYWQNIRNTDANGWAGLKLSDFINSAKTNTGVVIRAEGITASQYGFFGYVQRQTYRHNLCAIGYALNMIVDGSRSAEIKLRSIPTTVSKTYTNANIIGSAILTKKPTVSKIEYYTYQRAKIEQIGELSGTAPEYSQDNTTWFRLKNTRPSSIEAPVFKNIEYDLSAVAVSEYNIPALLKGVFEYFADRLKYKVYVDGSTTGSNPYYTEVLRFPLSLEPDITEEQLADTVEENVETYNTFTVSGLSGISAISPDVWFSSYEGAFTGTLISKISALRKFAKSKGTVKAKVRLTNEKVGDLVTIPTEFGEEVTGIITRMSVNFGYEDVADIDVLEWS